jgi:hypothetical protein
METTQVRRCVMWTARCSDLNTTFAVRLNDWDAKAALDDFLKDEGYPPEPIEWRVLETTALDDKEAKNAGLTGWVCQTSRASGRMDIYVEPHIVPPTKTLQMGGVV